MPSSNTLFIYIFYLWRKHDVTIISSIITIGRLPIVHVTQLIELLRRTRAYSRFHSARHVATELTRPNPVDYAIWSVIQQWVYEIRVHDIDELPLRQRLLHVWCSLEQSLIDDALDQWPTCLRACVCARGGRFEHRAYFVTINLFSLYLTSFMFHTMIDATGDVLRVYCKSMKCDVYLHKVA